MSSRTLKVPPAVEGERLDRAISQLLGVGRRQAAALVDQKQVSVGSRWRPKAYRVSAGDELIISASLSSSPAADPSMPLEVVLEREQLVVVNKPAGQPSAPRSSEERGCLVNALTARYPEMLALGGLESGLIHRLDTGTSGLLVAARSAGVRQHLHGCLRAGLFHKTYLAVVCGSPPDQAQLTEHLAPAPHGARVVVVEPGAPGGSMRSIVLQTLERVGALALVRVQVSRAYRHQIRVLLAHAGLPIVNDERYGQASSLLPLGRHALHAELVRFPGDELVGAFEATAPAPADLRELAPWRELG